MREETYDSGLTRYGADWLDLCLPLGALANLDQRVGAYPFDEAAQSQSWREPLERWFEVIGRTIFHSVTFEHAVTGFEVSGVESPEVKPGWVGLFRSNPRGWPGGRTRHELVIGSATRVTKSPGSARDPLDSAEMRKSAYSTQRATYAFRMRASEAPGLVGGLAGGLCDRRWMRQHG